MRRYLWRWLHWRRRRRHLAIGSAIPAIWAAERLRNLVDARVYAGLLEQSEGAKYVIRSMGPMTVGDYFKPTEAPDQTGQPEWL